jgi:hypothetical protein
MNGPRSLAAASLVAALVVAPVSPASAGKAKRPPDLSGQWRLDPSRTELPRPRAGRGEWGGRGGGGFPGGRGGFPGGRGGAPGGRGGDWGGRRGGDHGRGPADSARAGAARLARLPNWIRIDETLDHVTIRDSTGLALLEVVTSAKERAEDRPSSAVLLLGGTWKGDRLEVERTGPRGGRITEKYRLEDKGRTLVIETRIEPNGRRPAMTLKRVYSRVES